jgi:hypothetical protein
MVKTSDIHPLAKKIDRVVCLLESLLALELNKTSLSRDKIRAHMGIDKAKVNKMLKGIKKTVKGEEK